MLRRMPSRAIITGDSADVYFARAEEILTSEGIDPVVVMEVFTRQASVLCGIDEAKVLLAHVLADAPPEDTVLVEALEDGDICQPREVVLRIRGRYRQFGLYETAMLGMMAQSTGWATAARACVEAAAPDPVISFGARHVHPAITDALDYAAIVGGCVGASTPAGARLASTKRIRAPPSVRSPRSSANRFSSARSVRPAARGSLRDAHGRSGSNHGASRSQHAAPAEPEPVGRLRRPVSIRSSRPPPRARCGRRRTAAIRGSSSPAAAG